MAHTVDSRAGTPANDLRDLLDAAERELPVLTASSLEPYLLRLDQMDAQFASIGVDADLRPEQTRWQDLQARLAGRAGKLLKLARSQGGFAALRTKHPPASGGWWHLDELIADRRRATLKRTAIGLLVAAVVLAVGAFAYQRFLAPSPETILVVDTISKVEQLAMDQKWSEALPKVEGVLQTLPDQPDLLIWAAVLAQRLGDSSKAEAYLERAKQAVNDPLRFQLALGMRQMQTGDFDRAERTANAARTLNEDEPQVYFILANVAEARNEIPAAVAYYEKAAQLGESTNPQLTVISKMRLGMLLQQPNFSPVETPDSASPTP